MTGAPFALPGTEFLSPAKHTAFYDRYQRQYAQTVAWLQRALREQALQRDRERSDETAWLAERRHLLAEVTGFDQIAGAVTGVESQRLANGASAYQIDTECGLRFTGLLWEAATSLPRGMVMVGSNDTSEWAAQIAHYRANGLRVVMPCLAQPQHSYADHPERKWYFFADDELLHLLFFLVGGSLAGLEAAELVATARALGQNDRSRLPVALHLRDRHLLTGAVAAALGGGLDSAGVRPFDLLVAGEEAALLDHQEMDVRINTIWSFHQYFDSLTLWQLAQGTNLLFVEPSPAPSACYSRMRVWFDSLPNLDQSQRSPGRLVSPSAEALARAVANSLSMQPAEHRQATSLPSPVTINALDWDASYSAALTSKHTYLEMLHERAQQQRRRRYDLAALTPDEYRARIAASLERVAGAALPETKDRSPRTRRIRQQPMVDLYEVVLVSVPLAESGQQAQQDGAGLTVAGYLLAPASGLPAPAVICQHGLGGRPEALVGFDDRFEGQWAYDQFARRLAEKGYVVFVPFMNWGWPATPMRDTLVKHAYALGLAPNRFEVAQLHAIVDFLQARPEVLANRIAFYGLSYGGHASLWLCAHEPRLAAVVTAGHFNDWQAKLTSTTISPPQERPTSYLTVDEGYDMFNYNVLNELGHAELATRFVPRPQFVENGLRDAVTPTAWVDREFAHTQAVFTWLGAGQNVELEHFQGPHRVWAEGSFRFLERHLRDA
jgi:dienelactone hydrolase